MDELKGSVTDLVHGNGVNPWIYSACVFALVLLVGTLARRVLWTKLMKWAEGTSASWDEELLARISAPVSALIFVLAFGIAGQSAPSLVRTHPLMVQGVKIAMIAVMVWLLERALSVLMRSTLLPESLTSTSRHLFVQIFRVLLFFLGILIVLDTVGVSITPLLASLGISSLAVALALQDTLSNFFGGLYLLVDKPIRLGDWVKIDDVEGQVERIGWRSTRIRLGTNDTVTLPNNKVSGAQLKNYDMPSSFSVMTVPCSVAYGTDLERVEQVVIDVASEVLKRVPGGDSDFEPKVAFKDFADSAITFVAVLQATRFSEFGNLRSEFIKALHARFLRERIEIPYPQQVIHWNPPPEPAPTRS